MHLFKTQLAARQIINSLNFLFENCDFIKDFQFFGVALSMVLLLSLGIHLNENHSIIFIPEDVEKIMTVMYLVSHIYVEGWTMLLSISDSGPRLM